MNTSHSKIKIIKLIYGLILSSLFVVLILSLPHETPRVKGTEDDLGFFYIPMARDLAASYLGEESYQTRDYAWSFHGATYPAALLLGRKLLGPDDQWGYFNTAKIISALAGGSIILMIVLWLKLPAALLAFITLLITPLFMENAFSGGTDLIAVALVLWAGFFAWQPRLSKKRLLLSGILLAVAIDMRHEYIILLPFMFYFLWRKIRLYYNFDRTIWSIKHPTSLWFFIIPLLFLAFDLPNWNGAYNVAYKYKKGDALQQDLWPEWAFSNQATDDIEVTYHDYLISQSADKYPNIFTVLLDDPIGNFQIWLRDVGRGLYSLLTQWTLCFLAFFLVIFLIISEPKWEGRVLTKLSFWALIAHYLFISSSGFFMDRYFLLEVVLLTIAGSAAVVTLISDRRRQLLLPLVLIPFMIQGGMNTYDHLSEQLRYNGDKYLFYQEIVQAEPDQPHPIMLSRDPGIPFIADAEWHQFPKGLTDLHRYCLDREIRYIRWGTPEHSYREEWRYKLDDPLIALPEFQLLDDTVGKLYYVNDLTEDN
ncbi:MAG: hypothetical protein ABIE92_07405 [bacterium]